MSFQHVLSPSTTSRSIRDFINEFHTDPALSRYESKLQDHILSRLRPTDGDTTPLAQRRYRFTAADREAISLDEGLRMIRHKKLFIRTPTYTGDLVLDTLSRKDGSFIVRDTRSPVKYDYRFGQVLDIFHISIVPPGQATAHYLDILFVRWYEVEENGPRSVAHGEYRTNCPPRLKFVSAIRHAAFGFLDPRQVLRAVTIVPDLAAGTTASLLGPSIMRFGHNGDYDYKFYLVACCVDHDLQLRFHLGLELYNLAQPIIASAMPSLEDEPLDVGHGFPAYLASGRPFHAIDNPLGLPPPVSAHPTQYRFFGLANDSDTEPGPDTDEDDTASQDDDEAQVGAIIHAMDFD